MPAKAVTLNAGEVYGKWVVVGPASRKTHYVCRCECGTEREVHKNSLRQGISVSCGCNVHDVKRKKTENELVGQKFGRLTVIGFSRSIDEANYWNCECECGGLTEVKTNLLKSGQTRSCGCLQKEMRATSGGNANIDDKTGKKFGRLTAIEISHKTETGLIVWRCSCECGTESHLVRAGALNSGEVKSCGCLLVDQAKINFTKHGLSQIPEYAVWQGLKARCHNTNLSGYINYGGRGIIVCERWLDSFENFYADMGSRPKGYCIDRIDNDKGYSPENCRWADYFAQSRNRRNTIYVQHDGLTKSLAALAEQYGIVRKRLYYRVVVMGWPLEEALDYGKFKRRNTAGKARSNKYQHLYDASHAVSVALRCGKLIKPDACEFGNCGQPAAEAHHHMGYASKDRLNVQWLCKACHYRIHSNVIEFNGMVQTIKEWAADLGIIPTTLRCRLASPKWTLAQALTIPNTQNEII